MIVVGGAVIGSYRGDFYYNEGEKHVCEDVKAKITKTPIYRFKIKCARALYPDVEFREIF